MSFLTGAEKCLGNALKKAGFKMGQCTNPKIGALIHAYELRTLGEKEVELFEMHLLDCDYCFNEVSSFSDETSALIHNNSVQSAVENYTTETGKTREATGGIWHHLWPKKAPLILRPAFIYALILILVTPAYIGLRSYLGDKVRPVQLIGLYGTRAAATEAFVKDEGNDGVINFLVDNYSSGDSLAAIIRSSGGAVVYEDRHLTNINSRGIGHLYLRLDKFNRGEYSLEVLNPKAEPPYNRNEYNFEIK
jgi:hypothetical protein